MKHSIPVITTLFFNFPHPHTTDVHGNVRCSQKGWPLSDEPYLTISRPTSNHVGKTHYASKATAGLPPRASASCNGRGGTLPYLCQVPNMSFYTLCCDRGASVPYFCQVSNMRNSIRHAAVEGVQYLIFFSFLTRGGTVYLSPINRLAKKVLATRRTISSSDRSSTPASCTRYSQEQIDS